MTLRIWLITGNPLFDPERDHPNQLHREGARTSLAARDVNIRTPPVGLNQKYEHFKGLRSLEPMG